MSETMRIFVDDRPVEVEAGGMLLEAIRSLGVAVPTLCRHPSLEPSGACRLCLVEITHPDWKGWSGLVASCLYPVEPGLRVFTRTEKVQRTRRTLLELYLARCPDSERIRAIARDEGVDLTPFPPREGADRCVMCGLCLHVCQDLGPSAIAPLGRGIDKMVGPRPDLVGEDCTGCGACAEVCPTGEIRMERREDRFAIWNREFSIPLCAVKPERCRGCGVCEEVCPHAVPRVVAYRTGAFVSSILSAACTGCGICAGACPTGAIEQEACDYRTLAGHGPEGENLENRVVCFACSRSPLAGREKEVISVPCIGRVPVEALLDCLARGASGVLLLCRDQATCPSGAGGSLGEERSRAAEALAASAGLGQGRIAYSKPRPGPDGPAEALAAFRERLKPSPLKNPIALDGEAAEARGLDRALALLTKIREHLPCPAQSKAETLFYLGDLLDLDLLLSLVVREKRLSFWIEGARELLARLGMAADPAYTARQVRESGAKRLVVFSRQGLPDFKKAVEIVTLDELAGVPPLDPALEGRFLVRGKFRFSITQKERRELAAALEGQTGPLRCGSLHELAQVLLLRREGAWQEALLPEPFMAYMDAKPVRAGERES